MFRRNGQGKISYRGLMALVIGLVFIWFAVNSEAFEDDIPPLAILVIMFLAGAALVYGGLASLRFVWNRSNLVRFGNALDAEICVLIDDDTERGTETVHVRFNGKCQALGVDPAGVSGTYNDGKIRKGQAWIDERGKVHAVAIDGKHFNTLIGGTEIPAAEFGNQRA